MGVSIENNIALVKVNHYSFFDYHREVVLITGQLPSTVRHQIKMITERMRF